MKRLSLNHMGLLFGLAVVAAVAVAGTVALFASDAHDALLLATLGLGIGFGEVAALSPQQVKEAIDDLGRTVRQFQEENTKLVQAGKDTQKESTEKLEKLQGRIDELETKLKRPALSGREQTDPAEKSLRHKALMKWARVGISGLSEEERQHLVKGGDGPGEVKALSLGDATAAGFMASSELTGEITKGIVEYTPARALANVRQTSSTSVKSRKRTGTFAARRVAEMGTKTETTGLTYGAEDVPVHELYAMVDVSMQMLEDADFNLEAELAMEASEQFGVKEGNEFILGTGVGMFEGIVTNSAVTIVNSGHASQVTHNGIIDLVYTPKSGYLPRAGFLMRRATIGKVRKLQDGNGQYMWQPSLIAGQPATLHGFPVYEAPDVAAVAADAKAIVFGDFKRGYDLIERTQIEMLRDPYTQAAAGKIRFIFRRRSGGQVVVAEAMAIQKIAA